MIMRYRQPHGSANLVAMAEQAGRLIRVVAVEDDARYRASLDVLRHSEDLKLADSFAAPGDALDHFTAVSDSTPCDLVCRA
jgi:hypothetical protein